MKNSILILFAFLLYSCNSSESRQDEGENCKSCRFNWLEGEWQFEADNVLFYESWKMHNDTLLSGNAFMLIAQDTVSKELISVEYSNGEYFYSALVEGQNEGKAVKFRLISDQDSIFIFENKEHDYPTKITYKYIDPDHYEAVVAGETDGVTDSTVLYMTRKKT